MKKVAIAISTYDRLEYTRRTIESIIKNTVIPYSMVVVDDGSKEDTINYLEDLYKKKIIRLIKNTMNKKPQPKICIIFNV